MKKSNELVSIITPVYNCAKLLPKTIECVLNQTYENWEMLLVDDCTPDNSAEVINEYVKRDKRIKYFKLDVNSGAAIARNKALKESKGRFIAYLDADDLWKPEKLEKQVKFMIENNYAFTCTDYEKITEDGVSLNKIIRIPKRVDYNLFLRNTIIQTVGVMVDTKLTGKEILQMPNIRRRQDAATWCQLLKNGFDCYECPEVLSYYRVVTNSLSSNKFKAIKMNWYWYRKIEKLPLWKACYCFVGYAFNAVKKRMYKKVGVHKQKKKVLYIATTADNRNRLDGETIKCKLLREYLNEVENVQVFSVDTDNWKKHIIKLVFLILYYFCRCDEVVVSSADKGANIVLNFFRKINTRKKIYYFVIGGSLARNIREKNWNIKTYTRIKHIFVEANSLKNDLNELKIENVDVLNNFRKVKSFKNTYEESKNIKFVYFGRVIKEKGIEEAIKLVNRLNEESIECTLDIYGQCKEEYLKKLKNNFNSYIIFHGEIKPDCKTEYEILSQYDVFLFPTEYPGECLPGALIDCYISGLAVIASNWKYATEYIEDGKNGFIFEYKNYEDMYFKTIKLIKNNKIKEFKKRSKELSEKYLLEEILKDFSKELRS